jgi:hypothetical protein
MAVKLAEQGADTAALTLARQCLAEAKAEPWAQMRAVELILELESPDAGELLLHRGLNAEQRLRLISSSNVSIGPDTIAAVCEPVLADAGAATGSVLSAAAAWLNASSGQAAVTVAGHLRKRVLPPASLVEVLRAFARNEVLPQATELLEDLMRDPTADAGTLADGLRLCADHLPEHVLDGLVSLITGRLLGSERTHVAAVLRSAGRPDLGLALWRAALVDHSTAIADRIEAADQLVALGQGASAAAMLIEASRGEADESRARTLRKLVAWVQA